MVERHFAVGFWRAGSWYRAGLGLVVAAGLCALPTSAQGGLFSRHKADSEPQQQAKPGLSPSQPPAFAIPVEPLGFFAPGAFYQGQRESLVSLDFLDEDRLLFTFHVPGLIRRAGDPSIDGSERQIRAVVLKLPEGSVTSEALWTLHDRARYVWMLKDGRFLLRDRNDLQVSDGRLETKPLFHFQGPVLWLEMDPTQQMIVTNSREPEGSKGKEGDVPSPTTASANVGIDVLEMTSKPDIVLRILRRVSGKVMLVSRVRSTIHLAINSEGYLETLRSTRGREWILNLNYFSGGNRVIGKFESACTPAVEFISDTMILATTCNADGSRGMIAMSTDGRRLWRASSPPTQIWPRLTMAPNGMWLARETLTASHPVETMAPLSFDDVKGQLVEVYDTTSGMRVLTTPASPVLDGGGNVAISPSGKRVAVLNAGAIQVFELPPSAVASSADDKSATH